MDNQNQYTDSELVERILNHETELFELIIRRSNPYLYRIGKMYRYSHEDTQDLMQDSYIEAFTHLHQFQNRASLRTWISKIMLNQCYRKSQKWAAKNMEPLENNNKNINNIQSVGTMRKVLNTELKSVVEDALLEIPENYRAAFTLREVNGFSVLETANILDITESNVKVRVSRAKSYLRAEIEKSYSIEDIFEFNLIYCDEMVNQVMQKIDCFVEKK